MLDNLIQFLIQWGITSFCLWMASRLFSGMRFSGTSSLVVSALLLGFANAIVRPIFVILTLPISLLTLGLFLLVINAMMLLLVAAMVRGFTISGFWTAFFASIFISVASLVLSALVPDADKSIYRLPDSGQTISI